MSAGLERSSPLVSSCEARRIWSRSSCCSCTGRDQGGGVPGGAASREILEAKLHEAIWLAREAGGEDLRKPREYTERMYDQGSSRDYIYSIGMGYV